MHDNAAPIYEFHTNDTNSLNSEPKTIRVGAFV